jgi:predicted transglutaminase-like cysteine proteinase
VGSIEIDDFLLVRYVASAGGRSDDALQVSLAFHDLEGAAHGILVVRRDPAVLTNLAQRHLVREVQARKHNHLVTVAHR